MRFLPPKPFPRDGRRERKIRRSPFRGILVSSSSSSFSSRRFYARVLLLLLFALVLSARFSQKMGRRKCGTFCRVAEKTRSMPRSAAGKAKRRRQNDDNHRRRQRRRRIRRRKKKRKRRKRGSKISSERSLKVTHTERFLHMIGKKRNFPDDGESESDEDEEDDEKSDSGERRRRRRSRRSQKNQKSSN